MKANKTWLRITNNQNGFISWDIVNSIANWFFRFIIAFLIGLIASLDDIVIPCYQESINDIQYMLNKISILF